MCYSMDMLFHPKKNIGREVKINGNPQIISYVTADKKSFRIKSEENGPVTNDYDGRHIQSAQTLTISVNGGTTWSDVGFYE